MRGKVDSAGQGSAGGIDSTSESMVANDELDALPRSCSVQRQMNDGRDAHARPLSRLRGVQVESELNSRGRACQDPLDLRADEK